MKITSEALISARSGRSAGTGITQTSVQDVGSHDAVVLGGAGYMFHWLKPVGFQNSATSVDLGVYAARP
jgi:hypothetical protein